MNTTTESEKRTPRPPRRRSRSVRLPRKPLPPRSPVPRSRPAKPKADRANKKAEVIAMMKRAKGATLAEIMAATEWQAHTVRGFVSILGSKGGED